MVYKDSISIITPIYNCEKYIKNTVESVFAQKISNWFFTIVDDGSTDKSANYCDEYANNDNRFLVIHTKNKGVSIARNYGINVACGEWITFLDGDDLLMPNALQNMLLASKNSVLVVGNYIEFPGDKQILFLKDENVGKNDLKRLSFFNGTVWGKLFRKENIKSHFSEELSYGEDTLFLYEYLKNCSKITTIRDIVYKYRRNNIDSLSHKKQNLTLKCVEKYTLLINDLINNDNEYCQAYFIHHIIKYAKTIASVNMLTKYQKIDRFKEIISNKYFLDIPLTHLKLSSDEMRLFVLLKLGDLSLIEKGFNIE